MTSLIQPFKIKGKIVSISDTQVISDKFKKRNIVLSYIESWGTGQREHFVNMDATNTVCDWLNNYPIGSIVEVIGQPKGNKYEKDGKVNYFNSLNLTNITKVEDNQPQNDYHNTSAPNNIQSSVQPPQGSDDDLPF